MKQTSYKADLKQVEPLSHNFQAQYKSYVYSLPIPNSYVVMTLNTGGTPERYGKETASKQRKKSSTF